MKPWAAIRIYHPLCIISPVRQFWTSLCSIFWRDMTTEIQCSIFLKSFSCNFLHQPSPSHNVWLPAIKFTHLFTGSLYISCVFSSTCLYLRSLYIMAGSGARSISSYKHLWLFPVPVRTNSTELCSRLQPCSSPTTWKTMIVDLRSIYSAAPLLNVVCCWMVIRPGPDIATMDWEQSQPNYSLQRGH